MSTDVMNLPGGTSPSDDPNDPRLGPEIELRDLVYQSLERDGLITRLKAQLRAAVFTTIEKSTLGTTTQAPPSYEGMTGRVCRALVLDWLEHSHLFYTEDIFKVETSGAHHPAPLNRPELLEQLHMKSLEHESQPILHALLQHSTPRTSEKSPSIDALPAQVKQSIDQQFPTEKISDVTRLRDHFRSLFSTNFDATVLDAYLNKNLSPSMTKKSYEQVCLKWMQACASALTPSISAAPPTQSVVSRGLLNTTQIITPARRSLSPPSNDSSSSNSSSSSSSRHQNKATYDFPLPSTTNKSLINKSANIIPPPPLIDFGDNDSNNEDEEDTSASLFSKRNATPAELNRLKTIEKIAQGDETPRTRTTIEKLVPHGIRNAPVEYDDESQSHSIISSVDDITVDKASPSPSAQMDFLDDF